MLTVRKMQKQDVGVLFEIALRAFQPDFEKHGEYPPLIDQKHKKFMPPLSSGVVILQDDSIIGGAFALTFSKRGEIAAIFIDPSLHRQGLGAQAMALVEGMHPKVRKWSLGVSNNVPLQWFFQSLGYARSGDVKDRKGEIIGVKYQKIINPTIIK